MDRLQKLYKKYGINNETVGSAFVKLYQSRNLDKMFKEYKNTFIKTKDVLPYKAPIGSHFKCWDENEELWFVCTFTPSVQFPNCFTDTNGVKRYSISHYDILIEP